MTEARNVWEDVQNWAEAVEQGELHGGHVALWKVNLDFGLELGSCGNIWSREHPMGLAPWKDPAVFHSRT